MSDPISDLARLIEAPDRRVSYLSNGLSESSEERRKAARATALMAQLAVASTAEELCSRLDAQVKRFDEALDQDHEVGVKLVTFGQTVSFHVESLGYHNPALIFFYGETVDGEKVQLIQHISQISFVLMAIPKANPDQPRRAFGFAQETEDNYKS